MGVDKRPQRLCIKWVPTETPLQQCCDWSVWYLTFTVQKCLFYRGLLSIGDVISGWRWRIVMAAAVLLLNSFRNESSTIPEVTKSLHATVNESFRSTLCIHRVVSGQWLINISASRWCSIFTYHRTELTSKYIFSMFWVTSSTCWSRMKSPD